MTLGPFQLILDQVQDGFAGIHSRLDTINGRTRQNEQDIAVLKDRGNRNTAAWGGGTAITVIGLIEALKALFQ